MQAFFELLRAGLWEKEARLLPYMPVDYETILQTADNQSIAGLIAAGMEHVVDTEVPLDAKLEVIGRMMLLEQRNKNMNAFISRLFNRMEGAGITTLLVKGQGIAQCYERPLWRSCGDVDLFLDIPNYEMAKSILKPYASNIDKENPQNLHYGLTIDSWIVELHGTLRSDLGRKIDKVIDEVQAQTFNERSFRSWNNEGATINLPAPDNDIIYVFTHILQHYFHGGIGLRQICDWCRLLWMYHLQLDTPLLENRLRRMGLLPKWKAFAALTVEWLGMPVDAIPLYSREMKWKKKANVIQTLVMESGNFGQSRDRNYKKAYPALVSNIISFWIYTKYSITQFSIFPTDAIKGWGRIMKMGVRAALKRTN